jgi:cytochrome P450
MQASTATATGFPPGPPLPRMVQTLGFMLAPARFLDTCRRRYGDVVSFSTLFDSRFVIVFEPEIVKQLMRGHPEQLHAGEANAVLGPVVGSRSVLLLDEAEHLRHRRLMLPAFHGERMRAYEQVMGEATDRAIDAWPVGRPFPLLRSMQSLTLDVIVRAVFGVQEGARQDELKARLRAMVDPVGSRSSVVMMILSRGRFGIAGNVREFESRRRAVDELLFDEIARRREAPDLEGREDVFSMLVLARDEDGRPLSDQELRDELVTLLVAGHETTATGLAWTFELLLRNPRVLDRLRAAVDGDDDEGYLDAVVKEALRLRPVISGIGRVVRGGPYEVGGYEIPAGVEVNPSIAGIHRRADRYPQPREFRPERFLGPDAPDTYTWMPFGGGVRRCLGASFAMFEMKVVIRRVLQRTELRAVGRRPEKAVRKGVTFVPAQGARVVMAARPRAVTATPAATPTPTPTTAPAERVASAAARDQAHTSA